MRNEETTAIDVMFNPSSIAVIGATENIEKIGGKIIPNMLKVGFRGKVFPVNPNRKEILGFRCYPSVKDIEENVDLACITTPPSIVPDIMRECAQKKVRVAVVITSGFGEAGENGKRLEDGIVNIARQAGMRICGPNCYGVISPVSNTSATFCRTLDAASAKPGEVSIVIQSGAIGGAVLSRMWELNLGVSRWVSSGNEADLQIHNYIDYLVEDPYSKVIVVFLEGVRDGKRFVRALQKALSARKPVVILKTGKSKKGGLAARSHTGALTGSYEAYKAVFNKTGVIEVNSLEELIEVPMAFAWQPLPKGNRIGVISTSGGVCSIVADICEMEKLELPDFTEETSSRLRKILPPDVNVSNPLDLAGRWTPDIVKETMETISDDPRMDILLSYEGIAGPIGLKLGEKIVEASKRMRPLAKPMFVAWMAARSHVPEAMELIANNRIPLYSSPEKALKAIGFLVKYATFLKKRHTL